MSGMQTVHMFMPVRRRLGAVSVQPRYTETAKGQYKGKVDTEIPKTLTRCTGGPKDPNYGKWQDKDDASSLFAGDC